MAIQKGSITQTTKSINKKLENVQKTNITLDIEQISDNKVRAIIDIDDIVEPYVRHRMSGAYSKGSNSKGVSGHMYDPLNTYKVYIKRKLTALMKSKYPTYELCKGEISFDIVIWKTPPKSFTVKQNVFALIKNAIRPMTKPDIDNVAKTAMDICSNILWHDDNQIVSLSVSKYFKDTNRTIITTEMEIIPLDVTGRASKEETILWKKHNQEG